MPLFGLARCEASGLFCVGLGVLSYFDIALYIEMYELILNLHQLYIKKQY